MRQNMNDKLRRAKELAEQEPDEALRLCNEVMDDDMAGDQGQIALFMSGYLMMQAERYGIAYHIFERCAQLRPNQSEIYSNMGMCLEEYDQHKAAQLFEKAIKLNPNNVSAIANAGLMYLQTGKPHKCIEYCNRALKLDPNTTGAIHNKGLARLMLRDFGGWDEYYLTLGIKHRKRRDYGLPDLESIPEDKQIIVYGEQGVGDEIMFASCLPDLMKNNRVILDCDSRLESLLKRSFPDIPIYGTRFKNETPILDNHAPNHQVAIGQLPYFFRRDAESYPGTPYLKPDPDRVKQWDVLLDRHKPRVGIAWRGGLKSTGEKKRSFQLSDFSELLKLDCEFVNLDYKLLTEQEQKIVQEKKIKNWPRAVLKGVDLEDTVALIANLDCVVTVCTTVVYIAGAMGIPCYVVVPDEPGYRYHLEGDSFPWYKSVKLFRGKKCLKSLLATIQRKLSHITS